MKFIQQLQAKGTQALEYMAPGIDRTDPVLGWVCAGMHKTPQHEWNPPP